MAAYCSSCENPQVREINHRIREGRPLTDISRWLKEIGTPITRQALARHAKGHLGLEPKAARPGVSGDFLVSVRDRAHERMENGELAVSLKDGIAAQKQLDHRAEKMADHDLMLKLALVLTARPKLVGPDVEAIEATYRPLLEAGT